ncbi:MAG: LPS assembly lipoprotein LptE [Lysobacteraceae bacterium]
MRPINRLTLLVALLSLLSACGFQLRQSQELPATLSPLRIEIADPYRGLGVDLGEALQRAGLTLSENGSGQAARLRISKDVIGLAPLTIGTSGRVQEYALRYVVEISLTDKGGKVVLPRQEIELSRDYAFDTAQSLGSPGEEEVVREELSRDMVAAIMRRIEAAALAKP